MRRPWISDARPLRIAIIGAGLGGVATVVKLEQAGFHDVTVFERSSGPGGVWWTNTYPGAEVDVDSHAYSYSFARYDWSRTHATQTEVQQYVEHVIDRYGVRDRFRFESPVEEVRWIEEDAQYLVTTGDGFTSRFDLVVSSVGLFGRPQIPAWATGFKGSIFHTSAWRHDVELTGRRVALVGTGSTACQVGPAIAPQVAELVVFQREPGYVMPKKAREFTPEERERYRRSPVAQWWHRMQLFRAANRTRRAFRVEHPENARLGGFGRSYIARKVEDPDTVRALTPTYPYGCKRVVFTSDWYPMFNRANVRLVPHEVVRASGGQLVDADGGVHDVDAVILATGFRVTDYLSDALVYGRDGTSLHDVWDGEPAAFLGVTVPGFPNFFMLYGPNTNGGWSIIAQLERQAELVVRAARVIRRRRAVIDTRPSVDRWYQRWLVSALARRSSVLMAGCRNYFHTATGKNVTQWPGAHPSYFIACKLLPRLGWSRRRI